MERENLNNVINEINNLVTQGTKEVILAGINTGTYGKDLGNINLSIFIIVSTLLNYMKQIRIEVLFLSIFIDIFVNYDIICNYLGGKLC